MKITPIDKIFLKNTSQNPKEALAEITGADPEVEIWVDKEEEAKAWFLWKNKPRMWATQTYRKGWILATVLSSICGPAGILMILARSKNEQTFIMATSVVVFLVVIGALAFHEKKESNWRRSYAQTLWRMTKNLTGHN